MFWFSCTYSRTSIPNPHFFTFIQCLPVFRHILMEHMFVSTLWLKTDLLSVSGHFQDRPPPLPAQWPVGVLDSSVSHRQSLTTSLPSWVRRSSHSYKSDHSPFIYRLCKHHARSKTFYCIQALHFGPEKTTGGWFFFNLTYFSEWFKKL